MSCGIIITQHMGGCILKKSDGVELMHHQDEHGDLIVRQTWDGSQIILEILEREKDAVSVRMPSAWLYAIWDDGARKRRLSDVLERQAVERTAAVKLAEPGGTEPDFPDIPRRKSPESEEEWTPEQVAAAESILDQLTEDPAPADSQPASVLDELLKERDSYR